jgi:hypothetical protein
MNSRVSQRSISRPEKSEIRCGPRSWKRRDARDGGDLIFHGDMGQKLKAFDAAERKATLGDDTRWEYLRQHDHVHG